MIQNTDARGCIDIIHQTIYLQLLFEFFNGGVKFVEIKDQLK